MTLLFEVTYGPNSPKQLDELEAQLGVRLGTAYRTFLVQVGGGHISDVSVPNTAGMGVLQGLYKPEDLARLNAPERRARGFAASVPQTYLLIGRGSGGAPYLRVGQGDEGSVWWADYDKAGEYDDEEPHPEIMIRLADNFDTFLDSF